MKKEELTELADVLLHIAIGKCDSLEDAQDAVNKREMSFNYLLQYVADDPAAIKYRDSEKAIRKGSIAEKLKKMLPDNYDMSAKTNRVIDIVSEIIDSGEKVVIFCHWKSPAKMLKAQFDKIENANTVMYTGEENQEERDRNVYAFKNDPTVNIIIGTEAMAEGLNLQVCPFLIHIPGNKFPVAVCDVGLMHHTALAQCEADAELLHIMPSIFYRVFSDFRRNAQKRLFHDAMGRSYPIPVLACHKMAHQNGTSRTAGFIGTLLLRRIGESPDPLQPFLTTHHISSLPFVAISFPI